MYQLLLKREENTCFSHHYERLPPWDSGPNYLLLCVWSHLRRLLHQCHCLPQNNLWWLETSSGPLLLNFRSLKPLRANFRWWAVTSNFKFYIVFSGVIFDICASYSLGFYVMGVLALLSSIILLLSPHKKVVLPPNLYSTQTTIENFEEDF